MNSGPWSIVLPMLIVLTSGAPSQESAPPGRPVQPSGRFTLRECVNEFTASRVESTAAGYQYWFVGKDFLDGRTVKMSVVRAHSATHAPHRHAEDELFFILEGTAEVFLDGEKRVVQAFTSVYCPPHSEHGIRNAGSSDLKYLVIKKYGMRQE